MSSSDTGFDWFSILAVLVAGGIGLAKSFGNKSKNQRNIPRPFASEYGNEQNTEEEEIVGEYNNPIVKENQIDPIHFEPIFEGGDYYKQQPEPSIEFSSLFKEEPEEEEEHPEFDARQAMISSEILRRPQY